MDIEKLQRIRDDILDAEQYNMQAIYNRQLDDAFNSLYTFEDRERYKDKIKSSVEKLDDYQLQEVLEYYVKNYTKSSYFSIKVDVDFPIYKIQKHVDENGKLAYYEIDSSNTELSGFFRDGSYIFRINLYGFERIDKDSPAIRSINKNWEKACTDLAVRVKEYFNKTENQLFENEDEVVCNFLINPLIERLQAFGCIYRDFNLTHEVNRGKCRYECTIIIKNPVYEGD